jgi:bifunctional non-homologous end joining protein LigD
VESGREPPYQATVQEQEMLAAPSHAVAPLSPRARPEAPVSMPVNWSQVKAGLDPQRFTMGTAPALLAKSKPWEDYCDGERSLRRAIEKLVKAA